MKPKAHRFQIMITFLEPAHYRLCYKATNVGCFKGLVLMDRKENQSPQRDTARRLVEFLEVAITSIVFLKGIYPPGAFERQRYMNLVVHRARHPQLNHYIHHALNSLLPDIQQDSCKALMVELPTSARKHDAQQNVGVYSAHLWVEEKWLTERSQAFYAVAKNTADLHQKHGDSGRIM